MLSKDQHCLDSILESIEKILIYTAKFKNPDQFNDDNLSFDAAIKTNVNLLLTIRHSTILFPSLRKKQTLAAS